MVATFLVFMGIAGLLLPWGDANSAGSPTAEEQAPASAEARPALESVDAASGAADEAAATDEVETWSIYDDAGAEDSASMGDDADIETASDEDGWLYAAGDADAPDEQALSLGEME